MLRRERVTVIVLVILVSLFGKAYAIIPTIEREALISFYNSTGGENWRDYIKTNWLGDVGTECSWYGITCDVGENHVIEIDFAYEDLSGNLSSELGNLSNLKSIKLFENQLTGSIPKEIGNLTNLEYLSLGYNQLFGSIPKEIGNLTNLTFLNLDYNKLSGEIPSEITKLVNIEDGKLDIRLNSLYTSDQNVRNFLNSKQFLGDWESYQYFISTEERNALISLYNSTNGSDWTNNTNWLGGIGTECSWYGVTCRLEDVTELDLSSNNLSGSISPAIGNLTYLEKLDLSSNDLSGYIPLEITNLVFLFSYDFDIRCNSLEFPYHLPYEDFIELDNFLVSYHTLGEWDSCPGDLNFDSKVDLADAMLVLQALSGMKDLGINTYIPSYDVNSDDQLSMIECIYILRKVAN